MMRMKLSNLKHIHFIGIGGIGMSALARHFLAEKKIVSGSDRSASPITDALVSEGVLFCGAQVKENIIDGIDLVVYTEAMSRDHEELVAAREKNIPTINYFETLGLVANQYFLIAVAGAHGKTTTTAMLIDIFEDAGLDPSAVVGSLRARTGSNYRAGKSQYFIAEACEYKRDFLYLEPDILVITNVEAEHLDYYKDLDDVVDAFHTLAMKVPEDGFIVCNAKDAVIKRVVDGVVAQVVDYTGSMDLVMPMKLPGLHNRMNAAAAMAAAAQTTIPIARAKETLATFAGTWRRFEYKGKTITGALVYDDYGHHPTEIRATILGARELYPDRTIALVFQAHMYSRTHALFNDFVNALSGADYTMLLPIYAAREENVSGVTHTKLADAIREKNKNVCAVDSFEAAVSELKKLATDKDCIIVMGAGDIYQVAEGLLR